MLKVNPEMFSVEDKNAASKFMLEFHNVREYKTIEGERLFALHAMLSDQQLRIAQILIGQGYAKREPLTPYPNFVWTMEAEVIMSMKKL